MHRVEIRFSKQTGQPNYAVQGRSYLTTPIEPWKKTKQDNLDEEDRLEIVRDMAPDTSGTPLEILLASWDMDANWEIQEER